LQRWVELASQQVRDDHEQVVKEANKQTYEDEATTGAKTLR
jgi:hypothetical protein